MYEIKTPFNFYHDGVTKTRYEIGVQAIPEDAAVVAVGEGWAVKVKKPATGKKKQ